MAGMVVEIIYETHSMTTDNEAGIATGWLPGRLSAAGIRAAHELGVRRRADGIAAVFVSDLERARETVRIAFRGRDMPIVVDQRLRECNYGLMNGASAAVIERERLAHIDRPWPHGESYRQVVERTRSLLADLVAERDAERVLIVAHAANRWALQHLLLGADLAELLTAPFAWQPGWEFVVG
jgi:broad specificity phosphatase PhoE